MTELLAVVGASLFSALIGFFVGQVIARFRYGDRAFEAEERAEKLELLTIDRRQSLARLVEAIDELTKDSAGVAGLHQNGDLTSWESLIDGEFNSWLGLALHDARRSLQWLDGGRHG